MFIQDRIDQELHSRERSELKFGFSSEFFDKYLLDVFLRVFRFSKKSFRSNFARKRVIRHL